MEDKLEQSIIDRKKKVLHKVQKLKMDIKNTANHVFVNIANVQHTIANRKIVLLIKT